VQSRAFWDSSDRAARQVTSSASHSEGSWIESSGPDRVNTNASRFVKANLVTGETGLVMNSNWKVGLNLPVTLRNLIRI
jgi:hypothetical protein